MQERGFETASQRVSLDERRRMDADLGSSLEPPNQVDTASSVKLQGVEVPGTDEKHEER